MSKEDFVSYPSLTSSSVDTKSTTVSFASAVAPAPYYPYQQNSTFSQPNTAASPPSFGVCGKCQKPINVSATRGAVVMMSCRHSMHGTCFYKTVSELNLLSSCDEGFGGPQHCVHCFASPNGVNPYDFKPALDTDSTMAYFRGNFSKKYTKAEYATSLNTTDLSLVQKKAILGVSVSMFSRDTQNYASFSVVSGYGSAEVTDELILRGRTLDTIFANTSMDLNAQHLYRMGITKFEDFKRLGYDAARFGTKAYRDKCPYWMLVDLYNIDSSVLFESQTADALIATQIHPKELFLCAVSMDTLLEKKLTKGAFLMYNFAPSMLIDCLGLTHAHMISLNIRRRELKESWLTEQDSRVKHILSNIPQ